ncbi:pentapeptide repeat-containing protein [Paraburkholderia acidiphila]|uniref:Pentapeptide repeat-containing protein n=1 Tax=Paraburkholderia acidiphila TaxID=2571747 RepID=A0A7Z2JCY5_9BURK|nr:pentapeptide repeat-containing protein [Paraburkholderia acidiphila]QGZ58929.1 hypothetical protein FAZ97_28715 [Paraburkholderia acidiphila]
MGPQPNARRIDANEFARRLRRYAETGVSGVSLSGIIVDARVDLSGTVFKRGLALRDVDCNGELILANCTFEGPVWLDECRLHGGVDLSQCQFKASLSITACRLKRSDALAALAIPTLSIARSVIEGNASMVACAIDGCVSGRGVHITGDLSFPACRISGVKGDADGLLDLAGCRITGGVSFETNGSKLPPQLLAHVQACAKIKDSFYGERSSVEDATEKGSVSVNFTNAHLGDYLNLANSRFCGKVNLEHMKCRQVSSTGELIGVRPKERFEKEVTAAHVDGELTFSDAEIGYIQLYGITVTGAITFIAGKCGQIFIDDWCSDDGLHAQVASIGAFYMTSWHCLDFVRCNVSRINENKRQLGYNAIEITSSKIEKDLTFWPGKSTASVLEGNYNRDDEAPANNPRQGGQITGQLADRWNRHLAMTGKLRIANCIIRGDVDLTGIEVKERDKVDGRILISDTEIDGRVLFASPVSYLFNPRNDSPMIRDLAARRVLEAIREQTGRDSFPVDLSEHLASCNSLELQTVTASDIDLTGLCVEPAPGEKDREGRVDVVYSTIRRRVEAFSRLDKDAVKRAQEDLESRLGEAGKFRSWLLGVDANSFRQNLCAKATIVEAHVSIRGALNLQYSEVGQLKVSDRSFLGSVADSSPRDDGLVLDFAKLHNLCVARGNKKSAEKQHTHNGFPRPISLLEVQVDSWFLELVQDGKTAEQRADTEPVSAAPYLDLLDNDPEFRMSSYTAVERSLRNRGLDKEANRIYVAARFRDARTGKGYRRPKRRIDRILAWFYTGLWPWRRGDGRFREKGFLKSVPFLRRTRDWRETLFGGVTFSIWSVGFAFAGSSLIRDHDSWTGWLLFILIIAAAPLFLRIVVDRLYWLLLDYGTGAMRLAVIIFILMLLSFVFVSGEPANFEPTIPAKILEAQRKMVLPTNAVLAPMAYDPKEHPTEDEWTFGERVWMTLEYHVPLVSAVVSDEWEAAGSPLRISSLWVERNHDERGVPNWWPMKIGAWPKARDWFGAMQWLNWILWPLFLPFLVRKISRDR